ncbi:MAG: hypothetical protein HZA51_09035 [Planctomycetes bacterium]|nr:hypothetical protein [Planctomycetota bacterium]
MKHATQPSNSPRRVLEQITMQRPRCPRCSSPRLRKYRSLVNRDEGTAVSWVYCENEACRHRFKIIFD